MDRVMEPATDKELQVEKEKGEVQPNVVAAAPEVPSADQVLLHRAGGHAEYQPWCPACVAGRGREKAHHRQVDDRGAPRIYLDYGFFAEDKQVVQESDQSGRKMIYFVVASDSRSGSLCATQVTAKGAPDA
jgi:hypothetical protein